MKWFGIGLAIAGVIIALSAGFGFGNVPVTIAGVVFLILGVVIFLKS